ncbi:MAG: hypothetical protein LBE25_15625 [Arthrobacter sp.]|jgi:hypothetical protein|nr:hypothetical protein [Arthrobacter sp.]
MGKKQSALSREEAQACFDKSLASDDEPNDKLTDLAAIGDETVVEHFATWAADPPRWAQNLWLSVQDFTKEANWELIDGTKRSLVMPSAIPLRRTKAQPHVVGPETDGTLCPRCGHALFTVLDIDADHERFAGWGLSGHVRLQPCPACALLSDTGENDGMLHQIIRFSPDGSSALSVSGTDEVMEFNGEEITAWEIDPDAIPSPWRAGTWDHTVHVLGGNPAWEQDAESGPCPDCTKTMRHLAWLSMWELSAEAEWGSLFMQVCTGCSVARVSLQSGWPNGESIFREKYPLPDGLGLQSLHCLGESGTGTCSWICRAAGPKRSSAGRLSHRYSDEPPVPTFPCTRLTPNLRPGSSSTSSGKSWGIAPGYPAPVIGSRSKPRPLTRRFATQEALGPW